jgi:orotidine-5'-phosphate decarboxylase
MTNSELFQQIKKKKSFLCIGLDPDLKRFPDSIKENKDAIFQFNKKIIDATHHLAVAYKPNVAFYEALGIEGWAALEKTMRYIKENHPELFLITDAKRGDIGNTSTKYADAFFTNLKADAITVAPYMGEDSVSPFLEFTNKHTILLALTSNPGAFDFQTKKSDNGKPLYQNVLETSKTWKNAEQLMYVVGGTKPEFLRKIREIVPNNFLLVPGIGAQGGDLNAVFENALNDEVGVLINSTRGMIYASEKENFAEAAAEKAGEMQRKMKQVIDKKF